MAKVLRWIYRQGERQNNGSQKAFDLMVPRRGDIVVFQVRRKGDTELYCSRVVGLPGEDLEIRNGQVIIDGEIISIPELPERVYYLNAPPFGEEGQAIRIPEDSYYLLDDGSETSRDSRFIGFVNREDIYGKVLFSYS